MLSFRHIKQTRKNVMDTTFKKMALKVTIARVTCFSAITFAPLARNLQDLRIGNLTSICFVDSSNKLSWDLRVMRN